MSAESAVWPRIVRLFHHVENHLSRSLHRTHGLGLSEYRALQHLWTARNCELRMQDLAEFLGLNQSSVTRLVSRLEAENLTVRDSCPDDKRGVFTVLTDAGRKRYLEARASYERFLAEAFDDAIVVCGARDIVQAMREIGQTYCARADGREAAGPESEAERPHDAS